MANRKYLLEYMKRNEKEVVVVVLVQILKPHHHNCTLQREGKGIKISFLVCLVVIRLIYLEN